MPDPQSLCNENFGDCWLEAWSIHDLYRPIIRQPSADMEARFVRENSAELTWLVVEIVTDF